MSLSSEEKKTVNLKSSDGEMVEVDVSVIVRSQTIKHMIEDDCANEFIPLPNVDGKILAKVIEYCMKHHQEEEKEKMKKWDEDYLRAVEQYTLYDLILAANYLEVKDLLELCCQRVADMIKGKSPEEIRATFNIKNDFTPEEEAEIRKENQWALQ